MKSLEIFITDQTNLDLLEIWEYSLNRWGANTAEAYLRDLNNCMEKIASGDAYTKAFPDPAFDLRQHKCREHVIFYVEQETKIIIQTILHAKCDFINRLKERL